MFHLPLNPIAYVQKPQRSHRYVCVFEHALSNPDSARNIKAFNIDYTCVIQKTAAGKQTAVVAEVCYGSRIYHKQKYGKFDL